MNLRQLPLLLCLLGGLVQAEPVTLSLDDLSRLALTSSRSLQAGRAQVEAARAAVQGAEAFPNPEIEYLSGPVRPRAPGGAQGDARSLSVTQPLDWPARRAARIEAAVAGVAAAGAGQAAFEAEVLAKVRLRYYELLRRQAELRGAQEDQKLMEDIRGRIALRVESGEAPRFELIKADAEMLNAQKMAQAAAFRVEQSRTQLRWHVGPDLPKSFVLGGSLREVPAVLPIEQLLREVLGGNPELARVRAEVQRAESQAQQEKALRWPSLALKASRDEDPDMRSSRVGVVFSLPLWDRRTGPVGEATARLAQARHLEAERQFSLQQELLNAYQQYEIAQTQVTALESGIVAQAEAALKVAQAAYRFGERGILEVLDAQRVYRAARNELIGARYELAAAWAEIERLRVPFLP